MENFPQQSAIKASQVETTSVAGRVYEIDKLRRYAEQFPIQEIPLDSVREAVGPNEIYWIDRDGQSLAPFQIIQDWNAAQKKEAWADHVASIKRADLDSPIWMTKEGFVFDGVHRLSRAILENRETIKVRIFENLPKE